MLRLCLNSYKNLSLHPSRLKTEFMHEFMYELVCEFKNCLSLFPREITFENTNFIIISSETKTEILRLELKHEFKNLCKSGSSLLPFVGFT